MSIDLKTAKEFLDVIHNSDDDKLQMLLDGAIDEAVLYMTVDNLGALEPEGGGDIPASVVVGVMLLLQATYQATPDDADKLRRAAEIKLHPHRIGLGV